MADRSPVIMIEASPSKPRHGGMPLGSHVTSLPVFALIEPYGVWQGQRGHRWASREGRSRQVDRHSLRALYAQAYGQQDTVLGDDCGCRFSCAQALVRQRTTVASRLRPLYMVRLTSSPAACHGLAGGGRTPLRHVRYGVSVPVPPAA
jgi:hypothetical protein